MTQSIDTYPYAILWQTTLQLPTHTMANCQYLLLPKVIVQKQCIPTLYDLPNLLWGSLSKGMESPKHMGYHIVAHEKLMQFL